MSTTKLLRYGRVGPVDDGRRTTDGTTAVAVLTCYTDTGQARQVPLDRDDLRDLLTQVADTAATVLLQHVPEGGAG